MRARDASLCLLLAGCASAPLPGDDARSLDASGEDSAGDARALREAAADALDAQPLDVLLDASALDARTDAPAACPPGQTRCGVACVDLQTDEAHCGACGTACIAGDSCTAGRCLGPGGCAPLRFPSVALRTVPGPASLLALYAPISDSSCFPMPRCFLDTSALVDADTGARLTLDVQLSPNFTLSEFVQSELAQGYGPHVLVSPALVEHVQRLRELSGMPLTIASGYRSPLHQRAVCRSICPGGADCCPSASHPCGCRSRHEWGDAADLGLSASQYAQYGTWAARAGFPDCLLEVGSFHVDTSTCPLGCPYNF